MKKELMEILTCPVCKLPLKLAIKEGTAEEVISGSLNCSRCGHSYPVEAGIPNLLPPELQLETIRH